MIRSYSALGEKLLRFYTAEMEITVGLGMTMDRFLDTITFCCDKQTNSDVIFFFILWTPPECMFLLSYMLSVLNFIHAVGGPRALQSGKGPILFC